MTAINLKNECKNGGERKGKTAAEPINTYIHLLRSLFTGQAIIKIIYYISIFFIEYKNYAGLFNCKKIITLYIYYSYFARKNLRCLFKK